ncbi:hypothetical protein KUTeg_018436 [Tegillarca granosa]|uniref:Major facilitator superfamily domain-containing protein 3 n=1 Tax=Tegillarca granosa TaxID=220873 RepID=A0ABQ9EHV9_TEGGR|nr:hypothetical protein KUTeg_018436 [Tegillarca granosa]
MLGKHDNRSNLSDSYTVKKFGLVNDNDKMRLFSGNIVFLAYLYFIQGLPYGLQSKFLPVYFRTHGMSLTDIGFFKLLLTPWMCKALWAPLVDRYGTKNKWLIWSMLGLVLTCIMGSFTPPEYLLELACVLFLFNLLTSTQDIAVDGIAVQVLSTSELAYGNIAQVVGYKLGAIFGGGILTWLSEHLDWMVMFLCISLVYLISIFFVKIFIPTTYKTSIEIIVSEDSKNDLGQHVTKSKENVPKLGELSVEDKEDNPPEDRNWLIEHLVSVYKSPNTSWLMLFVLIYKLGEQGSLSMTPLFLIDKKFSASQVGFWTGVVGQVVSIVGSVIGGWMISNWGSYTGKSKHDAAKSQKLHRLITKVTQVNQKVMQLNHKSDTVGSVLCMCSMLILSGVVTTATFTMMMQCSQMAQQTIQATHYTTIATLEVLGKLTFSVLTGSLTDILGYYYVFIVFVILTLFVLPVLDKCPNDFDIPCLKNKKH